MITRTTAAKMTSVSCQPTWPMSATASGENRNCPNEPAAVPAPNASERHRSGNNLPNAASTTLNEHPERPKPSSTPADSSNVAGEWAFAIRASPRTYMAAPPESTRSAPKRSAIAPAKGCATPHNRFCTASADENTSRPQPFSWDIGVRKKPSAERGPNERIAIRQPHVMITPGVRQLLRDIAASTVVMDKVPRSLKFCKRDKWIAKIQTLRIMVGGLRSRACGRD